MVEEWRRLRDFGLRLHIERQQVLRDLARLGKKLERATENFAKAHEYVKQLEKMQAQISHELEALEGLAQRQSQLELYEVERLIGEHTRMRHLYYQATLRIYSISRLNEIFLGLLDELAQQVRATLLSSLDLLRYYARAEEPPGYLLGEFRQACGRLSHPLRVYQEQ